MLGSMLALVVSLLVRRAMAGLFGKSRAVFEVDPSAFDSVVSPSKRAWLVLYYASWCPHCVHYAPDYDGVATTFIADQRVEFAAMDCAVHSKDCSTIAVHSLPTLRAYHFSENESASDPKRGADVIRREYRADRLKFWLNKKLDSSNWSSRLAGVAPKVLPRDESTMVTSPPTTKSPQPQLLPPGAGYVKAQFSSATRCLGIGTEDSKSLVLLDCNSAAFRGLVGDPRGSIAWLFEGMQLRSAHHNETCMTYDLVSGDVFATSPCFKVKNAQWHLSGRQLISLHDGKCLDAGTDGLALHLHDCNGGQNLNWSFERAVADVTPANLDARGSGGAAGGKEGDHLISVTTSMHLIDAEVALIYSLHQGVSLAPTEPRGGEGSPALVGSVLSDLRDWLELLSALFPRTRVTEDLSSMVEVADAGQREGFLNRSVFLSAIERTSVGGVPVDAAIDPSKHWRACRTYTCGLWTLFHILTIAVAERSSQPMSGAFLGLESGPTPGGVLHSIRNFVARFFGCAECVENFLRTYDSCRFGRCDLEKADGPSFAVWLWQVHNEVTLRTAAKKGVLNAMPWPSQEDCGACWTSDSNSWDTAAVYEHLRSTFWDPEWSREGRHEEI